MDVPVVKKVTKFCLGPPKRTFCFQRRSFTVDVIHTVTMKYSITGWRRTGSEHVGNELGSYRTDTTYKM